MNAASTPQLFDENESRKLAEASLRSITLATSRVSGEEFFRVLVKALAEALDVCYVIAGRVIKIDGQEGVETLAVWAGQDYLPNMKYTLENTPCQNLTSQSMCFHPCKIQEEYPLDTLLVDMKAESYIGMPMIDTEGHALGNLIALDVRQIDENKRLLALSILSIFAARAAAELQHQDREKLLESRIKEKTSELLFAQKRLVEQEKLAALGNLVAGISHEINTPIGIAITAASGIEEFSSNLIAMVNGAKVNRSELIAILERMKQAGKLVEDNLKRAADLIGNFKALAVDQASDTLVDFDLGAYLHNVSAAHAPALRQAQVTLEIIAPEGINVRLPPGMVAQILSNLYMNSLKHGFTAGQAGTIVLTARPEGSHIVLDYRDDGVGVTPEVRAHMFEPFFTTRRGQGGSGLGLHIVYNLLQRLNGKIEIDDRAKAGLAYQITLPRMVGELKKGEAVVLTPEAA